MRTLEMRFACHEQVCKGTDCPLKKALASFNPSQTLTQARFHFVNHGLVIDTEMGEGLPGEINDHIFAVNCKSGNLKRTSRTSCGSIEVTNVPDML